MIGRAAETCQRVLILYDAQRRDRVSRLIVGNTHPACTTYPYRDAADLLRVEVFPPRAQLASPEFSPPGEPLNL